MGNGLLFFGLLLGAFVSGAENIAEDRIDWPSFLSRHDLTWEGGMPSAWHEGAFLGNGLHGAMIYAENGRALQWDVGRSDVVAGLNRIAIGRFELSGISPKFGEMRLDLWNAEARGTLDEANQKLEWRSYTHAERPITVIELNGAPNVRMEFVHAPAVDARKSFKKQPIPENERNPEPNFGETDGVQWCTQAFIAGGGYCVAWTEKETAPGKRLFVFTVDNAPESAKAVADVQAAFDAGSEKLAETHRAWWHAFWPRGGFLSIPDTRMESFYWIQMYKMASASRPGGPAVDLMGPWFRFTPWPRIWWNLNIQLTYWPVYAANRLELGESLLNMLDEGTSNLINNVPEEWRSDSAAISRTSSYDCKGGSGFELGSLTWAMHNYWLQYRYSGDEEMLRDRLYPLLRRAVMYLVHELEPGEDGKLHFQVDSSPEYKVRASDTNYNLALLRWGLQTLLAANERLGLNDSGAEQWREVQAKLAPFPVDETGYMIGAGSPLAMSHRHFSHLFMAYPLHLVNSRDASDRPLIEKSLDHWIGFEGALQGYSFTAASAMSSWLGRKDAAVKLMDEFLDQYLKPNTMYLETGPVIETPLAGASSIHEIVLQSWSMEPFGTDIRVFPAVSKHWKDATIHRMLAEGAFEVSASRRDGKTQFVQIKSLAGAPCRVWTCIDGPIAARGARDFNVTTKDGMTEIDLKKGETVLLTPADGSAGFVIEPVAAQKDRLNWFGARKAPVIQPDSEGNFALSPEKVILNGDALMTQRYEGIMNIGHWVEADEFVQWKLNVTRPGTFRVFATYSTPKAGGRFAVQVGDSVVETERQSTGGWDNFQQFDLGTLKIPSAGSVPLDVRSADGTPVYINLQEIRLVREAL